MYGDDGDDGVVLDETERLPEETLDKMERPLTSTPSS